MANNKLMSTVVVFLMCVVLSTSPVKAVDCLSVFSNMLPCSNYLGNFFPILPGTQCCDGASNVIESGDISNLCQCFSLNPLGPTFLPSKAQQLPNLCNLSSFLPLVNCLIPSTGSVIPLPSAIPFPPLAIPFPALTPIPPVFSLPPVA